MGYIQCTIRGNDSFKLGVDQMIDLDKQLMEWIMDVTIRIVGEGEVSPEEKVILEMLEDG